MKPEAFIAAVRARGSDATDLRDAFHEAHHAVTAKLKKPWERERIHQALLHLPRVKKWGVAMLVQEEIDARAVERVACAKFGIEYDVDWWAMMAAMETCKTLGAGLPLEWWKEQIDERCKAPRIEIAVVGLINRMRRKP